MNPQHYLFGPVPSRRLGRSLGVDLVPHKACTEDCIFCQCGPTPGTTLVRKEWVPTAAVLAELDHWFASGAEADAITLSGSGEPTLHVRFGDVLRYIRDRSALRRVLLSNGSLFYLPEVRRDALAADIVKATLSSWDQASFLRIHRPAPGLALAAVLDGLRALRREHKGILWIEVMLIRNINSAPTDVEKIARLVCALKPDQVHLNTIVRPPADSTARALTRADLDVLKPLFGEQAEVIADFRDDLRLSGLLDRHTVTGLLRRHPATAAQIARATGMAEEVVLRRLLEWEREGILRLDNRDGVRYFTVPTSEGREKKSC